MKRRTPPAAAQRELLRALDVDGVNQALCGSRAAPGVRVSRKMDHDFDSRERRAPIGRGIPGRDADPARRRCTGRGRGAPRSGDVMASDREPACCRRADESRRTSQKNAGHERPLQRNALAAVPASSHDDPIPLPTAPLFTARGNHVQLAWIGPTLLSGSCGISAAGFQRADVRAENSADGGGWRW